MAVHHAPCSGSGRRVGHTGDTTAFEDQRRVVVIRMDGSQVRTIFEGLASDDYGCRGATVVFLSWGGKMNALSLQDTAVAERDSVALFSLGNVWGNPEEDEKHLTWNRTLYRDVFAATGGVPVPNDRTGGCYINWPDPDLLELVFRGYAAESRWLSRTSGNRSQMAWSG